MSEGDEHRLELRGGQEDAAREHLAKEGGVALGIGALLLVARFLERIDPTIDLGSPTSYLLASALLIAVALFSASIPAWRATRLDPSDSLREL